MKKELPWFNVRGGRMKTTLYYGPWQCRREFMNDCQKECAREGHPLKGCMWLADFKFDWEGSLVLLPVPVKGGSRFGIFHCCCNYPALAPEDNEAAAKSGRSFESPSGGLEREVRKMARGGWKCFGRGTTSGILSVGVTQ